MIAQKASQELRVHVFADGQGLDGIGAQGTRLGMGKSGRESGQGGGGPVRKDGTGRGGMGKRERADGTGTGGTRFKRVRTTMFRFKHKKGKGLVGLV